jgi:hypothetical protein
MINYINLKNEKGLSFAGNPLFPHTPRSIWMRMFYSTKQFIFLSTIILNKVTIYLKQNKRILSYDLVLFKDKKLLTIITKTEGIIV